MTFIGNFGFLSLIQVVARVVNLGLVFVVARCLSVAEFGMYSYALSIAGLLTTIVSGGFNTLVMLDQATSYDASSSLLRLTRLKTWLAVCALGLSAAFLSFTHASRPMTSAVVLATLYAIGSSFTDLVCAAFRGVGAARKEATIAVSQTLVGAMLSIGVVVIFRSVTALLMLSLMVSLTFVWTSYRWFLREHPLTGKPLPGSTAGSLRRAFPFIAISFFTLGYFQVDSILLGTISDQSVLGVYAANYKLIYTLLVIPTTISQALFPLLTNSASVRGAREVSRIAAVALKLLLSLNVPLVAGGWVLLPDLTTTILGPSYSMGVGALRMLLFAVGFSFLNYPLAGLLQATERQNYVMWIAGVAFVTNLTGNVLLIPALGLKASALMTLVTEAMVLGFSLVAARPYVRVAELLRMLAKPCFAVIPMVIVLHVNLVHGIFIRIGCGALVYFLVLLALRGLTISDLRWMTERHQVAVLRGDLSGESCTSDQ